MDNLSAKARIRVFLSYSSQDARLARRLALDLEAANIDVWLDQWSLRVGEEFAEGIDKGVDEADFVLVLLTRASVASEWVEREWRQKFIDETQSERVSVVPVRGENCEIPDFLAQRTHADISGGSYVMGFNHLLEILKHYARHAEIHIPDLSESSPVVSENLLPVVAPIALEVGSDLIPMFETGDGDENRLLRELLPKMREELRMEFGFAFPGVRVRGNETDMPPRAACIMIDEVPETMFEIDINGAYTDAPIEQLVELGISASPVDGSFPVHVYSKIDVDDRETAIAEGIAIWDAAQYLVLALKAVIRQRAALLIDVDVAHRLVEDAIPTLESEIVPKSLSWFELTDILRHLVEEQIRVDDMQSILDALRGNGEEVSDTVARVEKVRHALRRQITAKFMEGRKYLQVILLDPKIEAVVSKAIQPTPFGPFFSLDPTASRNILSAIREHISALDVRERDTPLLTTTEIRRFVRKLVELEFPNCHVLSRADLESDVKIVPIASVRVAESADLFRPIDDESSA